ncbi:MAG: NusG domain II-containing protein [Clostridia bacterium]|nr:NusG domain II-containing protein [Clostridia bacterium]
MVKNYKTDLLIAVFVLFLAALCFLIGILCNKSNSDTVEIYVDNALWGTYPFGEAQLIKIDKAGKHICTVCINEEGVYMLESCCKNQICVSSGLLTREKARSSDIASWIVCLPNAVTVHLALGDMQ